MGNTLSKKKGPQMATRAAHPAKTLHKTATELLAEKMGRLVENAAASMSDRRFRHAEKKSKEITSRVRARASRRETA